MYCLRLMKMKIIVWMQSFKFRHIKRKSNCNWIVILDYNIIDITNQYGSGEEIYYNMFVIFHGFIMKPKMLKVCTSALLECNNIKDICKPFNFRMHRLMSRNVFTYKNCNMLNYAWTLYNKKYNFFQITKTIMCDLVIIILICVRCIYINI